MNQESPATNSNRRVRKRWIALGLIILAFASWKGLQPTYKGHGMQHWFDVYTRDGVQEDPNKPILPLSSAQKEALGAFQHFGTNGLVFLQRDLHDPRAWSFISQECSGPAKGGTQQDQFIGIVQALAPHSKEARDILEKIPETVKNYPYQKPALPTSEYANTD